MPTMNNEILEVSRAAMVFRIATYITVSVSHHRRIGSQQSSKMQKFPENKLGAAMPYAGGILNPVHSAIHVGSTTNLLLLSMYTLGNKYLLRTFTYYNYYCCCCRHTVVSKPNFLPLPPAAACIKTGLKIEKKLLEIGFDEDFSVLHVSISIARIVSNQTYVS